jgi:hypothetical protein
MPLGPPFQDSFMFAPEAGFIVKGHEIRRWGEQQFVSLDPDPKLGVATVVVFRTDISVTMIKSALSDTLDDWEAVQRGDPVAVAGHPGQLAEVTILGTTPNIEWQRSNRAAIQRGDPLPDPGPTALFVRTPMLAWQYAPNSWAVAQWGEGGPAARAAVQRLAAAVRIGPRPVPVPFTIDSLPSTVDERVALWLWDQPATQIQVSFGATAAHEPDPFDWLAGITIDLTHQRNFRPKPTPSNAVISILVNGRSVLWVSEQHGLVSEIYPDWWLEVRQLEPRSLKFTQADFLAVARSMRFATNIADRSTWFDAALALPH